MIVHTKSDPHAPIQAECHATFLKMLPLIRVEAQRAFRRLPPETREDLVEEVIANVYCALVRLVQRDKLHLAHATTLTGYAARQIRAGRRVGSSRNIQDVSSHYARLVQGIQIESLERFDSHQGIWTAALIEDRRAGPAETAAARIDVACWLRSLSVKNRRIAQALAHGGAVVTVARSFGLSASRISQLRRELKRSWNEFQGIDQT